jgi:hypothetical protein
VSSTFFATLSSVAHPVALVLPVSPPVAPSVARGVSIDLHCDHYG